MYTKENLDKIIPIVFIDFTSCDGPDGGKLFVCVGVTANLNVVPLIYAHHASEDCRAMEQTLRAILQYMKLGQIALLHMSDQGKAIVWKVKEMMVKWVQVFCSEHLARLAAQKYGSKDYIKQRIRRIARMDNQGQVQRYLNRLPQRLHKFIKKCLPPLENWCAAYAKVNMWGIQTSNPGEQAISCLSFYEKLY